jgi:hypothetical protein
MQSGSGVVAKPKVRWQWAQELTVKADEFYITTPLASAVKTPALCPHNGVLSTCHGIYLKDRSVLQVTLSKRNATCNGDLLWKVDGFGPKFPIQGTRYISQFSSTLSMCIPCFHIAARSGPRHLLGAGTRKVRHTLQELHDGEEIARGSGVLINVS